MTHTWDPDLYLRYADDRGRPFVDLLSRVGAERPEVVVDLGCGPGTLTALLARRWPSADVRGLDSSPEMVAAARSRETRAASGGRLGFEVADLRDWRAAARVEVLVSNATLQWVPDHLDLLPRLVDQVAPGGWFAFQVPGNADRPSHTLRRDLAGDPRYAGHLDGVAVPEAHDPEVYLDRLLPLGRSVDVWETTYLHVLTGEDAVFDWVSGTGARPTLQALPPALRAQFADELRVGLRAAYPPGSHGTVLPFRRVFAVLQK